MNWIGLISFILILVAVVTGGYYLFFKAPQTVDVVLPGNLQDVKNLSQLNLDPKSVVDPTSGTRESKVFSLLHDYTTPLTTPPPGKDNPFKSL